MLRSTGLCFLRSRVLVRMFSVSNAEPRRKLNTPKNENVKITNVSFKTKAKKENKRDKNIDKTKTDNKENKNHEKVQTKLLKLIVNSRELSRKAAEEAILEGNVKVNGKVVTSPSMYVDQEKDSINVKGKILSVSKSLRIWTAYKLKGELITNSDPQGRPTIFDRFNLMGLPPNLICVVRIFLLTICCLF